MATLRDFVRLVDGPLEGDVYDVERTPTYPLGFEVADGEGVEEFRYAPVMAPDGVQSRDDDGCLRFYFTGVLT